MELWQWIAWEDTQLGSWLAQADIPELIRPKMQTSTRENLIQFGPSLQAPCLAFPLVWGVQEKKMKEMACRLFGLGKIETPCVWSFNIVCHKDEVCSGNIIDVQISPLKVLNIYGEFANCLAEILEQLGWDLQSFSKASEPGSFSLTIVKPQIETLGDFVRGLTLIRAVIEILCDARGFKLASFELDTFTPSPILIDHRLVSTLKNLFI